MSGFVLVRYNDGISVVSDGGRYAGANDFTLTAVSSKPIVMPHISTVLCSVGSAFLPTILKYEFEHHWPSFDAMIDVLRDDVEQAIEMVMRLEIGRSQLVSVICVAGYSELRGRWESYLLKALIGIEGQEDELSDLEPAPEIMAAPMPDEQALERYGFTPSYVQINGRDDLIRFMRAMRATPHVNEADQGESFHGSYVIGGFIQHIWLTHDFAQSQIVWRWPDKIGELIDPENEGEPVVHEGNASTDGSA